MSKPRDHETNDDTSRYVPDNLAPEFAALRDIINKARRGEITLDPPATVAAASVAPPASTAKLPSSWYATPTSTTRELRPELRAALYGLAMGIAVLGPLAWWLSSPTPEKPRSELDIAALTQQLVADARARAQPAGFTNVEQVKLQRPSLPKIAEPDVDEAMRLIAEGDVVGARTLLATAAVARHPQALFVMAETYNPAMLEAWGIRHVNGDLERARALYAAANALGHDKAEFRLDGLK